MGTETSLALCLGERRVVLAAPESMAADLAVLFGPAEQGAEGPPTVRVTADGTGTFRIEGQGDTLDGLSRPELYGHVIDRMIRGLIAEDRSGLALHAGLVGTGAGAALVAGPTGAGKSSLSAWFAAAGFSIWTDELVVLEGGGQALLPLRRALVAKNRTIELISRMAPFATAARVEVATGLAIGLPAETVPPPEQIRLVILPRFVRDAELSVRVLSKAEATFHIMSANLNARNFADGGLARVGSAIAEAICIELCYGAYEQLDGDFAELAAAVLDGRFDTGAARILTRLAVPATPVQSLPGKAVHPIPEATPALPRRRLTIAMTTYDDYDGVYFSIQSLRMFHGEAIGDAEILVVDNNPDGVASSALKALESSIPNYRYYPYTERRGTIVRDRVFEIASGDYVLCMDCHVMFMPGSIQRLMAYFDAHPDTIDLLQGPLIDDRLQGISTHFEPKWGGGMWGQWASDPRGEDEDAAPFDIPMQGVGALACRRDAWPGYNRMFRGFGAEEGYIHEKFRQRGGRTLCLPFLRWLHRFQRPHGVPYPNRWEDRIFNYLAGFTELGLPVDGVLDHFRELLGPEVANRIFAACWTEMEVAGATTGDAARLRA